MWREIDSCDVLEGPNTKLSREFMRNNILHNESKNPFRKSFPLAVISSMLFKVSSIN